MTVVGLVAIVAILYILNFIIKNEVFRKKVQIDNKKDYTQIEMYKIDRAGVDYFVATYKDYEINKKNSIEQRFKPGNIIIWNEAQWEVISTPEYEYELDTNKDSIERRTNYYYVKVRYISKLKSFNNGIQNYGVIQEINGSNFYNSNINVSSYLENRAEFFDLIDKFLNIKRNDIDISDVQRDLKLLKYEIEKNDINKDDFPNLVNKLKNIASTFAPFASLANSIISIVQKII